MSDEAQGWLSKELQMIRNDSIPRIHKSLDGIRDEIRNIFGLLTEQKIWQAGMDERVKGIQNLYDDKHRVLADRINGVVWVMGSLGIASLGIFGWLFAKVVER